MKSIVLILSIAILCASCFDPGLAGQSSLKDQNISLQKSTLSVIPDSLYDLQNADITVSKHYRGHRASFSEGADAYSTTPGTGNAWGGEMFSFRHNFGTTVFNNGVNQAEKDAFHNGRVDFGVYSSTNAPNYTTADPLMAGLRDGVYCSAAAYASGVDSYKMSLLPIFLSGRNSAVDSSTIQYTGLTDIQMISRPLTFRQEFYSDINGGTDFQFGSEQDGLNILAQLVPRVVNKGGWYRCFTHWYRWNLDYSKRYFKRLDSLIQVAGGDVFFGSYNTVTEYYWAKEAVDSVKALGKTVSVYYHKDYPSSPYNRITTPVWIKVDLSGTAYAGNDITTSHGGKIRAMGGDVYYISYPLDFANTSGSFDITTTNTPSYINLNKPNVNRSGQIITSDQPVKIVVFTKLKTEPLEMKVVLNGTAAQARFMTLGTSFTVPKAFNTTTSDYYIGYINAEGISGVYQF